MSFELPFKLPTGWQVATVDELVKQKIIAKPLDGNHGGIHPKASDYIESGVPFVMASDLAGGRVDLIDCKFISEEQASGLRKGIAKAGDVLLSHKATIGRTAIVQDSKHDFIMLTPQVTYYRVINSSALSNIYLKAYFDSRFFQSILGLWAGAGSTRAYLGITGQLKLPIILPPIEIQNEISGQVHALNKKVNLNNEINQTLEEMAQAIFKSWFVDFDPVKAKMNGKQPEGMDAATASLFPEKLVESELGLIPDGWELTNIGNVSECFDKKRIPLSKRQREQKQGSIPYYGATSVMDYVDEAIFDDIYLLIGEDGSVMKDDGTPFIQYIWGPAWVNNHAHVLQGIKSVSTEQLMLFFQQTNINAYVTGAVQLKINQRNMNSIPFIKAPKEINERFYDVVAPLYAKIRAIKEENEQLAKLRDTLLPKLLSGEIELGATEALELEA
ncbi:restriction endonuclease subunit S [Vibrio parahaemolyticus]|nr:restriction endonuclease subunit S [Vibrio parahaemolyticus]